jgi:hypothetical protein
VRVVPRFAQLRSDQLLELLGDVVLEHLRLLVHPVVGHAQRLGEVGLDQAVVADHLQRHLLARRGEADAAVWHVLDQAEPGELLQHRGCGRRSHVQALRHLAIQDQPVALLRDRVDGLRVVLYRLGVRHV